MAEKQLKICMLGHKRIPSREGGIEIVVEELATRMVALGHEVTCYNRGGHHVSGKEFDQRKDAESIQEKVQKDSEQIIKILVEERYRQKKTQQEMADITGVRASNIARFEKASRVPTLLMLEKYANALEKHIEIRITEDKQ